MKKMDELINALSQKTGLSEDKARLAVDIVINYLKSKMPESVAGEVESALAGQGGSFSEGLGGFLGRKSA
jgi:nucleoid DNA-binding protein